MNHDPVRAVLSAARQASRAADARLLLAVSGGLDSMALLVAFARVAHDRLAVVATFDHGTGPFATAAVLHVANVASSLGVPVVVGRMPAVDRPANGWEDAWRRARHTFLREAASASGGRIVTAHTEDDQVETVLMRELRGAGARGLAGLAAPSPILRPFLGLRRATLQAFLQAERRDWLDEPSNDSPAFLRNRVRHDLLPAMRRADPAIDDALLAVGRAAAEWRMELEEIVEERLRPETTRSGELRIGSAELAGYTRDSLAIALAALAGRVGLALDRRGTHRLATFMMKGPNTGSIPLSGGWCLEARPGAYLLRRADHSSVAPAALPATGVVEWGRFRFRVERPDADHRATDGWSAALPADAEVRVRAWMAGDRLAPSAGQGRRRVTRYLSDAGVHGSDRRQWPVVVTGNGSGGDVVWIPGVRRSDAATERSGRPVRHYVCERIVRERIGP
jgi:tRNA(Ile)-lysidine synthase